jgi:hypothetical protein
MAKPPAPLPPEVLAAFEQRQPLEAIKLLLANRVRLAQKAKPQPGQSATPPKTPTPERTESIARDSGLSPGEMPSTSSAFWGWVVVALFGYLAYRLVHG